MPDRMIRDELLTSERYWAVSIEAQRLYIHLLLVADDTARFSGKNYTIRAACFPGQPVAADKVENLISELHDEDLIRLYHVSGERFIFIPRYRQRLRYPHSRYPSPPQEFNDIDNKKTDSSLTQVGPKSAEVKRSEVKRSEEKRSNTTTAPRGTRLPADWQPSEKLVAWCKQTRPEVNIQQAVEAFRDYWIGVPGQRGVKLDWEATFRNRVRELRSNPSTDGAWWATEKDTERMAKKLCMWPARSGESWNEFRGRIKEKLNG